MYSKRLKSKNETSTDLSYDTLSEKLRTQIYLAINDFLDEVNHKLYLEEFEHHPDRLWATIVHYLQREYGEIKLPGVCTAHSYEVFSEELKLFIINGASTEQVLDVIEVVYRLEAAAMCNPQIFDELEEEINSRFIESNMGYKVIGGIVTKHSSEYASSYVLEPAFQLLHKSGYDGAKDEFTKAFELHRNGDYKPSIVSSNNCFESTLKTVCKRVGADINGNDTASKLVDKYIKSGAFPSYKQAMLNNVSKLLQSSTNTIRNKNGGHGQGESVVHVPKELSEFCLNMTASIVIFIVTNTEEYIKNNKTKQKN